MFEKIVKRILWIAKCDCDPEKGLRKEWEKDPPKEVQCQNCKKWIAPKEETYTGKDEFNK